ncbi:hypothetical protein LOAG_04835 [Loa loa]|uniref:Uncharacterized protein n=1 Tax=Loa loa TaxID=7209 RepID=A0A1S0U120_LOALO|nr:hypothetical protein LOAG_04835 [Loa loa]EFO23651.1 hypothetical protein LOAG_04835 [Loa loa]
MTDELRMILSCSRKLLSKCQQQKYGSEKNEGKIWHQHPSGLLVQLHYPASFHSSSNTLSPLIITTEKLQFLTQYLDRPDCLQYSAVPPICQASVSLYGVMLGLFGLDSHFQLQPLNSPLAIFLETRIVVPIDPTK